MWTCPKCNRHFKNRNQDHSCGQFTIAQVFEKYPQKIRDLFEVLHNEVRSFGEMQIRAVKNGVMFSVKSTFLALKPHAGYLGVEFACGKAYDEFPVEKCVRISKSEYAHILRVAEQSDIDNQLLNWLNEAYTFNCSKK